MLILTLLVQSPSRGYCSVKKAIEPGVTVELDERREIYVTACPTRECDASEWATRLLTDPDKQYHFMTGGCLRLPFPELVEEYQLEAIRALFENDTYNEYAWIHTVTYISSKREGGETLWSISKWFTGDPRNYTEIEKYNQMSRRANLYKGTVVKIPVDLLSPAFKEPIVAELAARRALQSFAAQSRRLNADLILKSDSRGYYASYRMKRGDTIYSKVVMKYTDRVTADDVLDAAKLICERSAISNPRKLKAGDEVKIPLDLLSPMYLPPTHPRRQEYERFQEEAGKYSNPIQTADLMGVIVILDPGHGGNDPGAVKKLGKGIVYEDEVVYDIMCRIKRRLESATLATVIPTLIDKSNRYEPRDLQYFPDDSDEYLLTNPEYRNHDARVSANLRWYLANSIYRRVVAEGADPDKVVFVSLHADMLHPSARGTMIYIPGAYYCRGNGGKSGAVYRNVSEVREKQYVEIAYKDRVRSEGLSGDLAGHLIKSLKKRSIEVHSEKPVRNHVVRHRRAWVPAAIRHNIVPTKILIEVANMNNPEDSKLLCDPGFREKYAAAFVSALKEYYSN